MSRLIFLVWYTKEKLISSSYSMDFFDDAHQVVVCPFCHCLAVHTCDKSRRLVGPTRRFPALPRGSRLETGTSANILTRGLVPESHMISRNIFVANEWTQEIDRHIYDLKGILLCLYMIHVRRKAGTLISFSSLVLSDVKSKPRSVMGAISILGSVGSGTGRDEPTTRSGVWASATPP